MIVEQLGRDHALARHLDDFLTDQKNAGASPHTVRAYRGDLLQFTAHRAGRRLMDRPTGHAALRPVPAAARQAAPDDPFHAQKCVHGWASDLPGKGDPITYQQVVPELVVEVLADVADERGRWRHPMRYRRLRLDLSPDAVPRGTHLDAGPA
ncbi:hypothetical protein [Nonomuraea sp. NPDC005650]|uniref:hypothetical protein n=1 Tax=Nonomuraea sp. NPDC005650 TaxID=3157045 RepID=UPI00339E5462